ncbi:MAG TPA: hypothetical protein VJR69_06975 [Nitrospira sp.]|nr:hypothetical protein [Nitrospira sp.]
MKFVMVAAFHADHVIGATIANLSAGRAGLDAVLHVRIGRLIVVMHKAPWVKNGHSSERKS